MLLEPMLAQKLNFEVFHSNQPYLKLKGYLSIFVEHSYHFIMQYKLESEIETHSGLEHYESLCNSKFISFSSSVFLLMIGHF